MNPKRLAVKPEFAVFLVALAVNALLAYFIRLPGYMDAYYYFDGAQRLARGHGFTETYLWNYLDDPHLLPHPSHLYWMPLTSVVAALPMWVCGSLCPDNASLFRVAQIPSILLASLLPLIALRLADRAGQHVPLADGARAWLSFASAGFGLFAGFYPVFWANTDSFALYGVVGSLALVCAGLGAERQLMVWFVLAGALAALAHLTRADGMLLAAVIVWIALGPVRRPPGLSPAGLPSRAGQTGWRPGLVQAGAAAGAYLLVMLPWLIRNLNVAGSPLAPGGSQALWFTSYNELFDFPAKHTLATYLAAGWGVILAGKWEAVWLNLQTLVAVQGWIVLTPFIAIGLWTLRGEPLFRPAILYAGVLYFIMTFVFTFPGPRGGLFHSGTALMPFFAAAGPLGLERAVHWVARRRTAWNAPRATRVFLVFLGGIAILLTLGLYYVRVLGPNPAYPVWNKSDAVYPEVAAWLAEAGEEQSVVVVNNPPAFYYFSGQPAVVVPNGEPDALIAVAERFGAPWVILDANVPDGLAALYERRVEVDLLRLRARFADGQGRPVYLYQVSLP